MDTSLSAHQSLQLNSLAFVIFVCVAVVGYQITAALTRGNAKVLRPVRGLVLFALNVWFLVYFIRGLTSWFILAGLLAMTYLFGQLRKVRYDKNLDDFPGLFSFITIALWALLFLAKDPDLGSIVNPFNYAPLKLVGISFIFFRCINYIEDAPVLDRHSPLDFLNFMIFFPTLMSGPLERFDRFLDDYTANTPLTESVVWVSLNRIFTGVIMKFVFADMLYPLTGFGSADALQFEMSFLWLSFFIQLFVLFLDFAGYTHMMIGIGGLLGFKLAENFNRPFVAQNVQEFWERWHMSLTSFIQDYMFNPLSRTVVLRSTARSRFPLMMGVYFLTMMVIALWHGTTWGFFIFGLLHAGALVYIQVRKKYLPSWSSGPTILLAWESPRALAIFVTYTYVSFSMMFWIHGPSETLLILGRMMGAE